MKPYALAAAAAGAAVALAACSSSAATSAAPSSSATGTHTAAARSAAARSAPAHSTPAHSAAARSARAHSAPAHTAAPVNCPRVYDAWKRGPVNKLVAALQALDSASAAGDSAARAAALKEAEPAIASAGRDPTPACADPKGYWTALLMHVNAAAGSASTASERASITLALKGVPELADELNAELKRTAGA